MRATSRIFALITLILFAGAACSGNEGPCEGVVCGDNAHCSPEVGRCACDEGFGGDATKGCSRAPTCQAGSCSGHGTCDDGSGSVVCACEVGYAGSDCGRCDEGHVRTELGFCVADPCAADVCHGRGSCSVDPGGNPACSCFEGFAGASCDRCADGFVGVDDTCIADPCVEGACGGHGSCSVGEGGQAVCACETGYEGGACDECAGGHVEFPPDSGTCVADPCLSLDCAHGKCGLDLQGRAVCSCDTGYTGATCGQCSSGFTQSPEDEGACVPQLCTPDTCSSHGTCEMVSSSATRCVCSTGYEGASCGECASGFVADPGQPGACIPDLCAAGSCSGHGLCSTASANQIRCECASGYEGAACSECSTGFVADPAAPSVCIQNLCTEASCSGHGDCSMASAGNPSCRCAEGYTGGTCAECAPGFVRDPADASRCIANLCSAATCSLHGACSMAFEGETHCACNAGYAGTSCSDCADGYVVDPLNSSACVANSCTESTCSSHGLCSMTGTGARCTCDPGYAGTACDGCAEGYVADPTAPGGCILDTCTESACSGHGDCLMAGPDTTECACHPGYEGDVCASCTTGFVPDPTAAGNCISNSCNASSCSGHGSCSMAGPGTTQCACATGYQGATCESCAQGYVNDPTRPGYCILNTCSTATCSGHGTCSMASEGTTQCACFEGYTGSACGSCAGGFVADPTTPGSCIPNICAADTCSGHGECTMASLGRTACECDGGYTGAVCDGCAVGWTADPTSPTSCIPDLCAPTTCSGRGECSMVSAGNLTCDCDEGYAGSRCESCADGFVADPATSGRCIRDLCTAATCSSHGICSMAADGVTACQCNAGYSGNSCAGCADGYVEFPAGSGACILDPCDGVDCALPDYCNAAATGLVEYTGACVVLGPGSHSCTTSESLCPTRVCASGACVTYPSPVVGELAVTEIMLEPAVGPSLGQWFEVKSLAAGTRDLAGMSVSFSGTRVSLPSTPVVLAAGGRLVIGRNANSSTNGGVTVNVELPGAAVLGKDLGFLDLFAPDGSTRLESVIWDDSWNHKAGKSLTLSVAATDPEIDNDRAESWCFAQVNDASPGAENAPCEVDWCSLQSPASVSFPATLSSEPIYAQVFEVGFTLGSNPSRFIRAQLGWGSDGSAPGAAWSWVEAGYNPAFSVASNNEEFLASLSIPSQGTYDYAWRMSFDGGLSWKVCGLRGDALVGAPPPAKLVFSEYVEGSSNDKAIELVNADSNQLTLSSCSVRIYTNGATSPGNSFSAWPSPSLAAGDTVVICNSSASAALKTKCDAYSAVANFSGDDALEIVCDGARHDVLGQIGSTANWGTDKTLRRACGYFGGDPIGTDAFNPADQWVTLPKDTIAGLGDPACADPCQGVTCSSHGTCQQDGGSYSCNCEAGFDPATLCASCAAGFVVDPGNPSACIPNLCTASTCSYHGSCSMASAGVTYCACNAGYAGTDCGSCADGFVADPTAPGSCIPNLCTAATCSGNGTCSMASAGVTACSCFEGYAGPSCSSCAGGFVGDPTAPGTCILDLCTASTCSDHGVCSMAAAGTTSCDCDPGYAGAACGGCADGFAALPVSPITCVDDPCVPEFCSGHGTCSMLADGAGQCECSTGYAGANCAGCATDFVLEGGSCIHTKLVGCTDAAPANATSTLAQVEVTYTTGTGWSTPADCAWSCDADHVYEGSACIHTKTVECLDAAPANATSTSAQVEVTYTSGIGWSAPAACDWSCNTDYVYEGSACIHTKSVDCRSVAPANATSNVVPVTVTYTTGSGWSQPTDCDWSCDSGFHQIGETCAEDLEILWCSIQEEASEPAISLQTGQSGTFYGQVLALGPGTTDTTNQSPLAGMLAKVCTSTGPIAVPVDVGALDCTAATFNVDVGDNDEYKATLSFANPGSYNGIFAFSGDAGATWTPCFIESTGAAKPISVTAAPSGTLIFSEYVEGNSNNKAVEIYNGTALPKNLADCSIRLYTNGSTTGTSTTLSGTLAAGTTLVICNPGFATAISGDKCDQQSSAITSFNGDDALELFCNGATVDVIGQAGFDPGTAWTSGSVSTADKTLRRKCSVSSGDTNKNDAFDPALEWDAYSIDSIDGLKSRGCP